MIRRFNPRFRLDGCVIVAGEQFITRADMLIETVLGSCVAVCLRDPVAGVAGMNHFLLPGLGVAAQAGDGGRYGVHAMRRLVGAVLRQGGERGRLEAKVFGGGNVIPTASEALRVGDHNARFALAFLEAEEIPVVSRDVGGEVGRRIVYFCADGRVKLRRLGVAEVGTTIDRERAYLQSIGRAAPAAKARA